MNQIKNNESISFVCLKCNNISAIKREDYDNKDIKKIRCAHCQFVVEKTNCTIINMSENTFSEKMNTEVKFNIAYLLNVADSKTYNLNIGRNLIGRKSERGFANIAIDTGVDKTLSREHVIIDVIENGKGAYSFMIANYKNKNATYINNKLLCKNKTTELFNNDIIRMAKIEMKIIICGLDQSYTI